MYRNIRILAPFAAASFFGVAHAAPPATSPYFTDAQSSHVQDATSESIGQVNMIACVMASMRPDALVNQGAYVALIDQNKCDSAKSGSSDSSGGSQAPNYMTAVVQSTRASNTDPMLVSAWISINQQNTPVTVFAHISATEAPSSSNPYGVFRLDYCGKPSSGGSSGCAMNGYMQGGNGTLAYYETDNNGGSGGTQVTALQLSSVGTSSGSGSLSVTQTYNNQTQNQAFDFAYDASYFLRQDNGSGGQCFSRDATDPATGLSVWRYGLYDSSTGERINRNSGFPIQYTAGGTTNQGYVGYYGLSAQAGAPAPADGSTVQKVDYQTGGATTATYTVVSKAGRLVRYTKQTTTLALIDQLQLNVFVNAVGSSGLPTANTQYVLNWDEASQQFIVTGQMQCGQNGCQTASLTPTVSVDPSFWVSTGLQGWSQSLGGGDVFVALNNVGSPVDTTAVIYHTQDLVYPDDSNLPAALYCVSNCPTASSLQSYFTQSGSSVASPYVTATFNSWQPTATPVQYSLSGNVLLDGTSTSVVFTDTNAYQQYPQYQNGVMSGRLVADLSAAQCNTNPVQYCDWTMNNAGVYYQWQTGPNSWDQFTALKDANNAFVHFDAPLNVKFVVPANSDIVDALPYGKYAGTTMVLQYGDFGDLWGIPGSCVSSVTNQTVACTNDPTVRYVPAFAIPFDAQLGVVTSSAGGTTSTYLVKWLDREIRFAQKSLTTCTAPPESLTTTTATLPTAANLQDPSNSSSTVYNGTEPSITSAPRVIQGQVMY
jgi:hypothetical protein